MNHGQGHQGKGGGHRKPTTLEVLWICVAAAILVSLVAPNLGSKHGSHVSRTASGLSSLANAIDLFKIDCKRYPSNREGLNALRVRPDHLPGWSGPYFSQTIPSDEWGHPYIYRTFYKQGRRHYEVFSIGSGLGTGD